MNAIIIISFFCFYEMFIRQKSSACIYHSFLVLWLTAVVLQLFSCCCWYSNPFVVEQSKGVKSDWRQVLCSALVIRLRLSTGFLPFAKTTTVSFLINCHSLVSAHRAILMQMSRLFSFQTDSFFAFFSRTPLLWNQCPFPINRSHSLVFFFFDCN